VGETGSGKTTQLPQYAVEAGYRSVGCTQPRRMAAITVSQRVAQEMAVRWGSEVGYTVRFDDFTNAATRLKYMTDGILLQECMGDSTFRHYDVLFLDEVHERTLATDILLGLLKYEVAKSDRLRVVVMSATIDCLAFAEYFVGAPTLEVPGRSFPVEVFVAPRPVADYLEAALSTVYHILLFEPKEGDILVFLTGEEEIEQACAVVQTDPRFRGADAVAAFPLYSALAPEDQQRVFLPSPGTRKVIFSTNIAETSVTIPGIVYVVDCGFSKQKLYLPGPRVETLLVQPISKASARQRAGRAGRTQPGRCYRLYGDEAFAELPAATTPEVLRTSVAQVILMLARLGVRNVPSFPFLDPPAPEATIRGLEELQALGALNIGLSITDLGRAMCHFPIDPLLSATLLQAHVEQCTLQVAAIVAMLSVPKLFLRSDRESLSHADRAQSIFKVRDGDHLMLLKIYNHYVKACTGDINGELPATTLTRGCPAGRAFCQRHKLHEKAVRQAAQIRQQLLRTIHRLGLPCPGLPAFDYDDSGYSASVRRALCRGLFLNTAVLINYEYVALSNGSRFALYPSTSLTAWKEPPQWVLFHEAIVMDRAYLRTCTAVTGPWLAEVAPAYLRSLRRTGATEELRRAIAQAFPG